MDNAHTKYHVIALWWLTLGAHTKKCILELSEWFGSWPYWYKQWGGCEPHFVDYFQSFRAFMCLLVFGFSSIVGLGAYCCIKSAMACNDLLIFSDSIKSRLATEGHGYFPSIEIMHILIESYKLKNHQCLVFESDRWTLGRYGNWLG